MPALTRAHRAIAALVTAVIVASAAVAATGTAAAAPASNCTPAHLITVPGTFETSTNADPNKPAGLLAEVVDQVTQKLGNSVISTYSTNYQAKAFTEGVAYADSKKEGIATTESHTRSYAAACPKSKIVYIGYSQGADIAGDVLTHITGGQGPVDKSRVIAGILLADPGRGTAGEVRVGPQTPGNGVAGPRDGSFAGIPVYSICGPGDLYCSIGDDSPFTASVGTALTSLGSNNTTDATGPTKPTTTASGTPVTPSTPTSDSTELLNESDKTLLTATSNAPVSQFNQGAQQIEQAAKSGDAATVTATADNLRTQLPALGGLQNAVSGSTVVPTLSSFDEGTQQKRAGETLGEVKSVDVHKISTVLDSLAGVSEGVGADQLVSMGASLTTSLAPLSGVGAGDITSAANVVSSIQPTAILKNAADSADAFSRVDVLGIVNDLTGLTNAVTKGDFGSMPGRINALNDKLVGVVAAVDTMNLEPVATVLMMFPPNTPVYYVGLGVRIFNQLDLTGIAGDLKDIVKYGMSFDLLAIPPLVLDLATKAVPLTGISGDANIAQLSSALTNFDPKTLGTEITKATAFFGQQAAPHVNDYKNIAIDGEPNALTWMADCIVSAIRQAV